MICPVQTLIERVGAFFNTARRKKKHASPAENRQRYRVPPKNQKT
jgi:hypothetical protein